MSRESRGIILLKLVELNSEIKCAMHVRVAHKRLEICALSIIYDYYLLYLQSWRYSRGTILIIISSIIYYFLSSIIIHQDVVKRRSRVQRERASMGRDSGGA